MSPDDPLDYILSAASSEKFWAFYKASISRLGFGQVTYVYSHFSTDQSFGDPSSAVCFTTNSNDAGVNKDLIADTSKILHAAFAQKGARTWSEFRKTLSQDASDATLQKFTALSGLGRNGGYVIGFQGLSPRAGGALFLTGEDALCQHQANGIWSVRGERVVLKSKLMHLRMITLPHPAAQNMLTSRQQEVLRWVSHGKTIQDISVLMDLTPGTIEKHLRLARNALNVETTTHAVRKATILYQI